MGGLARGWVLLAPVGRHASSLPGQLWPWSPWAVSSQPSHFCWGDTSDPHLLFSGRHLSLFLVT